MHRVLEVRLGLLAHGIIYLHFCREAQGTQHISPEKSKQIESELGTWISLCFGVFVCVLLMKLLYSGRGETQGTQQISPEESKEHI